MTTITISTRLVSWIKRLTFYAVAILERLLPR